MDNSKKIILDLCGGTGSWSAPYKKAGYDVRLITLPFYDVRTYSPPDNVYGVLAAPPCTHFSVACNRLWDLKDKNGQTADALSIVYACLDIIHQCKPKFWALENPKGRLIKWLGEPTLRFNQCDFGAPYVKPTLLWGNFNTLLVYGPFTPRCEIKPLHELSSSELFSLPGDYNLNIDHNKIAAQRSVFPPAFCESFFLANQ